MGVGGVAKSGADGWIVLAAWEWDGDDYALRNVRSARVGGPEGIKADTHYTLTIEGEFKEVVT
jgi:hypothetical protein